MKHICKPSEPGGSLWSAAPWRYTDGGSETHTLRQEVGSQPREKRAISRDPVFARFAGSSPRSLCRGKGGKQIRSLICP